MMNFLDSEHACLCLCLGDGGTTRGMGLGRESQTSAALGEQEIRCGVLRVSECARMGIGEVVAIVDRTLDNQQATG